MYQNLNDQELISLLKEGDEIAYTESQISQSKNVLLQNKEWGGTFDPLQ